MATNSYKIKNSINLQPGSAPANPLRGDIYCSSADGKFYRYDDGVPGWVELGSGGGAGATVTVSQTGHGFATDGSAVGTPIRSQGTANTYVAAKADTAENAEVVGIITAVADANSFSYSTGGEITGLTGLTPNTVYFLSGATAGTTTATAPTTVGYIEKPLLIATATNKAIFVNMRGSTIGGTNLYTSIPLNNNGTTNLQTITSATGTGGFIEGVIQVLTTGTNYVTTFKAEFAVPVSGTDYPHTVQYGCDALPAGSSIGVTTGGIIQLTLPNITGFSSGTARFSMQAAAVGATLPLQISGSLVNGPVLGSTSGTAPAAGYIGETKVATIDASTTLTSEANIGGASLSLTPGVWLLNYSVSIDATADAAASDVYVAMAIGTSKITGTIRHFYLDIASKTTQLCLACSHVATVASTTTFVLRGAESSATTSFVVRNASPNESNFFAVRIA